MSSSKRPRLQRHDVVEAAVALADEVGIDALSMRTLAQRLDVVPMALYKHVANKDELLDAMVDHVVGEIEPAGPDENWRHGIRSRILSSRAALLRHPWAPGLIETRTQASPVVLDHMEAIAASFRAGGFSVDLTHRAMHAIGSRMWGFTQEVFPTQQPAQDETAREQQFGEWMKRYPRIVEMATEIGGSGGCDAHQEFEFALDLILDGLERIHRETVRDDG